MILFQLHSRYHVANTKLEEAELLFHTLREEFLRKKKHSSLTLLTEQALEQHFKTIAHDLEHLQFQIKSKENSLKEREEMFALVEKGANQNLVILNLLKKELEKL